MEFLKILSFLLFFQIIYKSNEKCLFYLSQFIDECLICDFYSYNENVLFSEPFKKNECTNKTNKDYINSKIYITSEKGCILCEGTKDNPYDNFIIALKSENLRIMKENYKNNSKITFKMFKGVHYILEKDIDFGFLDIFRRINLEIIIEPLFCSEENNETICIKNNEKVKIIIKSYKFSFFTANKLLIKSVIFDGSDIIFSLSKHLCVNEMKICCNDINYIDYCAKFNKNNEYYKFVNAHRSIGFFNLEKIIDSDNNNKESIIELKLINVDILNFNIYFTQSCLISIDFYSKVNIMLEDVNLTKLYFLNGIIYYFKIYNYLIIDNFLNNLLLKSNQQYIKINLINSIIDSYDYYQRESYLKVLLLDIFFGEILFNGNVFRNIIAENGIFLYLFEIKENCKIDFKNNTFINNSFHSLFFFNGYSSLKNNYVNYTNIHLINNSIYIYFNVHFKVFYIKLLNFESIKEPFNNLIRSEFSNISLIESNLKNLIFLNKDYCLINFESIYEISNSLIFLNAKKLNFYSNDTLLIYNCTFENINIQFFKNIQVTLLVKIEFTAFKYLNLIKYNANELSENPYSFMDFKIEKNFILNSCMFSNIFSQIPLIYINSFINIDHYNTIWTNITIKNSDLIDYLSYLPVDPNHQIVLFSIFFKNIKLINDDIDIIYVLNLHSRETGSGAAIILTEINFENIEFIDKKSYNRLLGSGGLGLMVKNMFILNSSNCILIYNRPKHTLSFLNISNIVCFTQNIIAGSIYNDAKLNIFKAKNIYFISPSIYWKHCIYIFNTDFIIVENIYVEGGSIIDGSLFFIQAIDIRNVLIKNIKLKNSNFSKFNSMRISINANNFKQNDFILNYSNSFKYETLNPKSEYGILNSIFEYSYASAINILTKSEILIKNCSFINTISNEGSSFNIMENSFVILISLIIKNSKSKWSGGTIYAENSKIIIFNISINNSQSGENGGIGYLIKSDLFIYDSFFFNLFASNSGGSFALVDTYLILKNITFFKSESYFFGGYFFIKNCIIDINYSFFYDGISRNGGGMIFMENSNYLISNSSFVYSFSVSSIFYISGTINYNSLIKDCKISNCFVEFNLFFINDNNCNLNNIFFYNNIATKGSFYELYGFSEIISINLYSLFFYNNIAFKNLFKIDNSISFVKNLILVENRCEQNYFIFLNDEVNLFNFLMIYINKNDNIKNEVSVILGENSNFNIKNSTFYLNKILNGISLTNSILNLYEIYFFKSLKNYGGSLNLISLLLFLGSNLYFYENLALKGGAIFGKNILMKLSNCLFYKNEADDFGSDIYLSNKNKIDDINIFLNVTFTQFIGTSIYITFHNIFINESNFQGNNNSKQALYIEKSEKITLIKNDFYNIYGKSIINIIAPLSFKTINLIISNCNFYNGSGIFGGFIYLNGRIKLILKKNVFINGSSINDGGALFYLCDFDCFFESEDNLFKNNLAKKSGGAMEVQTNFFFKSNDIFLNNTASSGDNINSYPSKIYTYYFENITQIITISSLISKCKKVNELNKIININNLMENLFFYPGNRYFILVIIADNIDNIQKYEIDSKILIKPKNFNNISLHFINNLALVNQGMAIFKDFIISSPQNISIEVSYVYSPILKPYSIKKTINIIIKPCSKGQIYYDLKCKYCNFGEFSLNYNPNKNSCLICPSFAKCEGGDSIIPDFGYWRKNENSSIIIKCFNDEACQLQNSKFIIFECGKGYFGNICNDCDRGYGKIKYKCIECNKNQFYFIISYFFAYLFCLTYTLFIEKQKTTDDYIIMLNKILNNHLSVFIVLSALRVEWGNFLQNFLFFTINAFSIYSPIIFSTDCFFNSQTIDNFQISMIIVGISPFYLVIFAILLRFLIEFLVIIIGSFRKKKKNLMEKLKMGVKKYTYFKWLKSLCIKILIIIYLGIYSNILNYFMKVFGCKFIDNTPVKYFSNFPNIECYSNTYYQIMIISLIFIIIWALIFPLLIICLVYRKKAVINNKLQRKMIFNNKNNIIETQILENQDFIFFYLIKGYKKKYYYWEIIILARKLFTILVSIASEFIDITSIGGVLILIFFCFLLLNIKLSPRENKTIENYENISLFITIISIGLGILTGIEDTSESFKFLSYILLSFFNIIFFCFLLYRYFLLIIKNFKSYVISKTLSNIWTKKERGSRFSTKGK